MACFRDGNYFIHEPAMLRDRHFCMPVRWFTKGETGSDVLYAKCWEMQVVNTEAGSGWRIFKSQDYVVPAHMFLKNFLSFSEDAAIYGVPPPERILGNCTVHFLLVSLYVDLHELITFILRRCLRPQYPNCFPLGNHRSHCR